jgi:hypothetical protein
VYDVIVIGAGVSGLAAAGRLQAAGRRTLVLERARGVGGRCATRRVDGRPVDFGLPFLHGRSPEFLDALAAVTTATPVPGWPRSRDGGGHPCQPEAFSGADQLLAFREGLAAFAKHLALGLDVRLNATVRAVEPTGSGRRGLAAITADGERLESRVVLVTVPAPAAPALIEPLTRVSPRLARTLPALEQIRTVSCLTVIAGYAPGTARPAWDISLPETTRAVHAILNDSSKRGDDAPLVLVLQGRAAFSREHLDRPEGEWAGHLLREAAGVHGEWVEAPTWHQTHCWTHARVQRPTELAAPLVVSLDGSLLAFSGDGFSPAAGVEGAYLSGLEAASRILDRLLGDETATEGAYRGIESERDRRNPAA